MVAPIDGGVVRDPLGFEQLEGALELGVLHQEGVMRLAERIVDLLAPAWSPIRLEEERAGAIAITQEHLVGQPHLYRHAEDIRVEPLGAREVGDVDAEVIEVTQSHRFPLRGLRSLMT